jgi:hypothetical protein
MRVLPASFWARTRPTDCVIWVAHVDNKGYGTFKIDGVTQLVHRLVYEATYGPIPDGMTIDHLCRVRNCIKPEHMEVVTSAENTRRGYRYVIPLPEPLEVGGYCSREHYLADESALYRAPDKSRTRQPECRECRRERSSKRNSKRRKARQDGHDH